MANAPLANIWFPDDEARSRVVAAISTAAAVGAAVTITIPNGYPPIDRTIPCPVLAIVVADNTAAGLLANGQEMFAIAGQMGTALAPDSAGEFRITGARTVEIFQQVNVAQVALIIYVAKGSGQET
jgi:sugar phosphate isomerase/epimerase